MWKYSCGQNASAVNDIFMVFIFAQTTCLVKIESKINQEAGSIVHCWVMKLWRGLIIDDAFWYFDDEEF